MGLADLHIHTHHSRDGASSVLAVLEYASRNTPLDVIAITDHNRLAGALEALDLAPNYGLEVIPGCEISTAEGHLLALFVHRLVPPGLSLVESIRRVGDQGGLCIVPHPLSLGARGLSPRAISRALSYPDVRKILVGIEVFNAGWLHRLTNFRAAKLAQNLPLARVANSDAHVKRAIGWGATEFPGKSAADLRRALYNRTTTMRISAMQLGRLQTLRNWLPHSLRR